MAIEIADVPVRFECRDCGEMILSRDVSWVERARQSHHCPLPEQIERALRGEYDG